MNYSERGRIFDSLPPVTKNILILNIVVFIISQILAHLGSSIPYHLALFNFKSDYFNPFQLVTHMFMHGGIGHIFFNMFAVFMFGRLIESVLGSKKFFILFMLSGIGAALLQLTITNFQLNVLHNMVDTFNSAPSPDVFWTIMKKYHYDVNSTISILTQNWSENPNSPQFLSQAQMVLQDVVKTITNIPMVGASGAVFGVLIAFAMMFPNMELMFIFIPVPIKAKYLIPLYAVLELFFGIANFSGDNIAHFAHLGGAIVGFILVKFWKKNQFTIY
jgi:membrane associated rhomboid family serine protease